MPQYRVTVTEVVTHSSTIKVDAGSEEEAAESGSAGGDYTCENLTQSTAEVFFGIKPVED